MDINKKAFTKETILKLNIFQDCFNEWFPVYLHNDYVNPLYIYDMFAGSGYDADGMPGSPIILLTEAKGEDNQYCQLIKDKKKRVYFGFNEKVLSKSNELKENVNKYLHECKATCTLNECCLHTKIGQYDFQEIIESENFINILNNPKCGKFILLDQYGFKQITNDVFLKLIHSPNTDFVFFIASSFINRFKELPAVTDYFEKNKLHFDANKPKQCHQTIADYYRSLIPDDLEYYIHSFTIQKGANYYGLIFGSGHTLGMEKFLRVCWKHDVFAGESNCNIENDFEPGTLFYGTAEKNKIQDVKDNIKSLIKERKITTNIDGLKYAIRSGCLPSVYISAIEDFKNKGIVRIIGEYNKAATNIHKVKKYGIELMQ